MCVCVCMCVCVRACARKRKRWKGKHHVETDALQANAPVTWNVASVGLPGIHVNLGL